MSFCADCPRRNEPRGTRQDDPSGKAVGTRGSLSSALVIINGFPSKGDCATGEVFSGGTGRLLNAALVSNGANINEAHVINRVNCYPTSGQDPTKEQVNACARRFTLDVQAACSLGHSVLVPIGQLALDSVYTPPKHVGKALSGWRGYVLDSTYTTRSGEPIYAVPTLDLETVRKLALKPFPWLQSDIGIAIQLAKGPGGVRLYEAPVVDVLPSFDALQPNTLLGFDIETLISTGEVTDIGLATLDAASSKEWR